MRANPTSPTTTILSPLQSASQSPVFGMSIARSRRPSPSRAPEKRWHTLRHTFGTHASLFGVNPWRLQSWMGHKRIDETMIYVHVAENHRREIPEPILEA